MSSRRGPAAGYLMGAVRRRAGVGFKAAIRRPGFLQLPRYDLLLKPGQIRPGSITETNPMFPEYGPRCEVFRGSYDDLADPDVSPLFSAVDLPHDPAKPYVLVRWLS
jgi:hypothetical protein